MPMWKRIASWFVDAAGNPCQGAERESPRFETRLIVSFANESASAETHGNVGIGGFCFQSERQAEPGRQVELLVDLDGMDHWVLVRGEVLGCVAPTALA